MITLVGLYDLSREEVAEMLHCSHERVQAHLARALDALSEIFLQARILDENRPDRWQRQVSSRKLPADVAAVGKRPCAAVDAAVSTDVKTVG
jgi:hypothetical protein